MELRLKNLSKEFDSGHSGRKLNGRQAPGKCKAVNNVNYTMHNGVYGLLGVNGAGKTTLMRMLCTLLKPTEGCIMCGGKDIFSMDGGYRKLLGYLPQDFGYYPEFSVQDYLMYIASIKGVRPPAAKRRVQELLEQVGMSKSRSQKMKKLSGGMKRRVGIAQAMINEPRILILDEPTSGLDPNERIRFRNLISKLAGERIVLLSTHIVSDVEYIADEILLMKEGEIIHSGTVHGIIDKMPAKVWSVEAEGSEMDKYLTKYKASNVKITADKAELRLLAEESPASHAHEEEPNLEDAFLYYLGEKAGNDYGFL